MVKVTDDRGKRTLSAMVPVNPKAPHGPKMRVHLKDNFNRKIQETVYREIVFEGEQLKHAIKRAKRWWKGPPRVGHHRAPSHIMLFSRAWKESDPEGFKKFMEEELTF